MAVQIGQHTGERVDVCVDFGVIARWLFMTPVLTEYKKHVFYSRYSKCNTPGLPLLLSIDSFSISRAAGNTPTISS